MDIKYKTLFLSIFMGFTAHAAVYKISSEKGKVAFLAKGKPALISIKGEGVGASGELHEENGLISGEIEFELKSLKTGIDLRDEHLKNKYLEVDKFPTAKVTISSLKLPVKINDSFKFSGVLNLHGVSQPIEGSAEVSGAASAQFIKSEFKINLSQFKIDIPSFKGITVAEEVLVKIETPVLKTE